MKHLVSFLKDYAEALQVLLTIVAILTTTAVAVVGYRVAEQQTQLLALEHRPVIEIRLDPSSTPESAVVPFVVQNTNAAGPADELSFQVLDFLEVDYAPGDDRVREDQRQFPGRGLALLPVGHLFWLEPTGAETDVLAHVRPIAPEVPRTVRAVARELIQDQSDRHVINSVHAKAFVFIAYRDQLGTWHTDYFEIASGQQGVRRISEERWGAALAHWFAADAHIIADKDLTTPRVHAEFLYQIGA